MPINDPLVREYMRRKMESQAAVDQAREQKRNMALAAGIGDIAGAFAKRATSSSVPLYNRWQDMGKAPQMASVEGVDVNLDPLRQAGKTKLQEAKDEAEKDDQEFWDEQRLNEYSEKRQDRIAEDGAEAKRNDPNSEVSKRAREYLRQVAPNSTDMAGFETMTAAQIERVAPSLMQSYNKLMDRKAEAAEDLENRQYKRQRDQEQREFRREMIAGKQRELNATQAKKRGLAELGMRSEGQYQNAIQQGKESGNYDPTSNSEFIDNSDWAPNWMKSDASIAARAAQDSWIESYLRDASGAAIPPGERDSYRDIYFPQPGDTPQVVQNKAQLRQQKMQNAFTASGSSGGLSQLKPSGIVHGSDLPD